MLGGNVSTTFKLSSNNLKKSVYSNFPPKNTIPFFIEEEALDKIYKSSS